MWFFFKKSVKNKHKKAEVWQKFKKNFKFLNLTFLRSQVYINILSENESQAVGFTPQIDIFLPQIDVFIVPMLVNLPK